MRRVPCGKRDTDDKPRLSDTLDMLLVVAEIECLPADVVRAAIVAARRSPMAAHRCYSAILASHGIRLSPEPTWTSH